MFQSSWLRVVALHVLLSICVAERDTSRPEYKALPPLREQARLQGAWTKERKSNIPQLLQKYGVGAWLVSLRANEAQITL
jgi:hypothetical protein